MAQNSEKPPISEMNENEKPPMREAQQTYEVQIEIDDEPDVSCGKCSFGELKKNVRNFFFGVWGTEKKFFGFMSFWGFFTTWSHSWTEESMRVTGINLAETWQDPNSWEPEGFLWKTCFKAALNTFKKVRSEACFCVWVLFFTWEIAHFNIQFKHKNKLLIVSALSRM